MIWNETIERYLLEGRTVSGGKGENSKNEMAQANKISAQQLAVQQQELAMQQQQLSGVNASLDPMIQAGGMSPQQQAALQSVYMNQLPAQFNNAVGQINESLVARGISGGPYGAGAGDISRYFGSLGAQEAALQSQGLANVQLAKQQQLMQELGLKLGVSGQFGTNIGTFGSEGISSLGIGQQAANAADQAQTSIWGPILGAAGSIGSAGIGALCWIAAELYGGWFAPQTVAIRQWFEQHPILARIYSFVGRWWADVIHTHKWLRRVTQKLFDRILERAIYGR